MLGPFTVDTYLPSFPAMEAEFGISRAVLSQSLALYLAAFAISTLILGPLADKLGRRLIILSTLILYVSASIGCALSEEYSTFLLFRLLQGIAAGGGLVSGRAMIRDVYNPEDAQFAMSRVTMMFAIAPSVAPIIGGWLHEAFGWHSVFYFLALYGASIFVLMLIRIPETLHPSLRQSIHPVKVARVYGKTLTNQRYQSLIFIIACYFGGIFLYIASAPTVIFDFLNLGSKDFIVLLMPLVMGMMLGAWINGRLAHRWTREKTVTVALCIVTAGTVLNSLCAYLFPPTVFSVVGPLVIYTIGTGMAMPAMTVLVLDCFPKNRGTAAAMQGFVQMVGNATLTSLAVPVLSQQPILLATGQFALIIIALILWYRMKKCL